MTSQAFQLRPIDGRGGHAAFWLIFAAAIKGLSALMFAFIIVLLANVQNLSREFVGVWDVIPTLSALIVVGFLVPMLFVALWIHRAAVNARLLSNGFGISPGLAVGWYFVPVANLFMPLVAMGEIWRISHDPANWRAMPAPSLLSWWWTLWLGSSFLGMGSSLASRFAEDVDGMIVGSILGMASAVCAVGAALLLRRIVLRITTRQSQYSSAEDA